MRRKRNKIRQSGSPSRNVRPSKVSKQKVARIKQKGKIDRYSLFMISFALIFVLTVLITLWSIAPTTNVSIPLYSIYQQQLELQRRGYDIEADGLIDTNIPGGSPTLNALEQECIKQFGKDSINGNVERTRDR